MTVVSQGEAKDRLGIGNHRTRDECGMNENKVWGNTPPRAFVDTRYRRDSWNDIVDS